MMHSREKLGMVDRQMTCMSFEKESTWRFHLFMLIDCVCEISTSTLFTTW